MENASKALLIAAGILIVILLIALGMRVFNSTGDATAQVDTQSASTSMQTFNAQFNAYKGRIPSSSLRNLIHLVNASNKANPGHQVSIDTSSMTGRGTFVSGSGYAHVAGNAIDGTSSYNTTFSYDAAGYINKITVNY